MAGNSFYFPWEASLIEWMQNSLGGVGSFLGKAFSTIGGTAATLLLLLVIFFCWKKEAGKRCGLNLLIASFIFPMIKNVALRFRPYMEHEGIQALALPEADADPMDILQQGYSFPSGHSASAAAMYVTLGTEIRKRWMWFLGIAMIILIGASRFMVGVHYPTDVLAGWAVGLLSVVLGTLLQKHVRQEWLRYVIVLAVGLTGILWCSSRDYFSTLGLAVGFVVAVRLEQKYINYQDTRRPVAMILRVLGGAVLYLALNELLKLPFSKEFLDNGTLGANLIRSARYAVIMTVELGVYPRLFPLYEKIGAK